MTLLFRRLPIAAMLFTALLSTTAARADTGPPFPTSPPMGQAVLVRHDPAVGTSFSTEQHRTHDKAPSGMIRGNMHLHAWIDNLSGSAHFEVVQSITYWEPRRIFEAVRFQGDDTTKDVPLTKMEHSDDNCPNSETHLAHGDCILTKTVRFALNETTMRSIAMRQGQDVPAPWIYQLRERNGRHLTGELMPAEAADLLAAIDGWQESRSAPASF